jgi:hypothetical protein
VSPSGSYPKLPDRGDEPVFPRFVAGPNRFDNLMAVKEAFPQKEFYLYVSDNPGDDVTSQAAGFTYVHPKDFR